MKRQPFILLRAFALGALLLFLALVPAPAHAAGGPHRVGVIYYGGEWENLLDGLRQGLRELGVEEGKHIVLDVRDAKGDLKAVEAAARALEAAKVDAIITPSTSVAAAPRRATTQVPLVFFAGADPVAAGLVESYSKPGGRLTGIHGLTRDLTVKRMEVLKLLLPKLTRAVTIYNPDSPIAQAAARTAREEAKRARVQLTERHARSIDELRSIVQGIRPQEFEAFFQISDAMITAQAPTIIEILREKRLPGLFHETNLCDKGGTFCYGQNYREVGQMMAKVVQRILAGRSPKDQPVENYTKIELVLNLRTAKQIGVALPQNVLLRADRVVE